jgi:hypothetical protein
VRQRHPIGNDATPPILSSVDLITVMFLLSVRTFNRSTAA